jgi:hypothetical protein
MNERRYCRRGDTTRQAAAIRLLPALIALVALMALSGCAQPRRPPPRSYVPVPIAPFDDAPNAFTIAGPHFSAGEAALVRVCVASDHTVSSTDLIGSSGDQRFDALALQWARTVRLRYAPPPGAYMQRCGEVRVEIRTPEEPRAVSGVDVSLG